jgi:hypothetical protein
VGINRFLVVDWLTTEEKYQLSKRYPSKSLEISIQVFEYNIPHPVEGNEMLS